PPKGHGWSFQEVSQRQGDFALVAAGVVLTLKGDVCDDVRIGYRNVGLELSRLPKVESLLEGKSPDATLIAKAAGLAMESVDPPSDVDADAAYRRDLVRSLTVRMLTEALDRAGRQ